MRVLVACEFSGRVRNVEASVWQEPPGPERKKNRSRTYHDIADAMAEQWGGSIELKATA